jgi:PAS domain S-box-containing protein
MFSEPVATLWVAEHPAGKWRGDHAMKSTDIVRTIFDNVSFPVLLIDRDYKIVEANHAALLHVNQRDEDVIGQSCFEISHASETPCWHSTIQQRLRPRSSRQGAKRTCR